LYTKNPCKPSQAMFAYIRCCDLYLDFVQKRKNDKNVSGG